MLGEQYRDYASTTEEEVECIYEAENLDANDMSVKKTLNEFIPTLLLLFVAIYSCRDIFTSCWLSSPTRIDMDYRMDACSPAQHLTTMILRVSYFSNELKVQLGRGYDANATLHA